MYTSQFQVIVQHDNRERALVVVAPDKHSAMFCAEEQARALWDLPRHSDVTVWKCTKITSGVWLPVSNGKHWYVVWAAYPAEERHRLWLENKGRYVRFSSQAAAASRAQHLNAHNLDLL